MTVARVLVVSDDRELGRIATAACRPHDAVVRIVGDMGAASTALSERGADLVVLDARTAGAVALVPIARSLSEGVLVVVAVDVEDGASVRAALDLGVDALVALPLTGDAVLGVLSRARQGKGADAEDARLQAELDRAERAIRGLRQVVDAAVVGSEELVAKALDAIADVAPGIRATVDMKPRDEPITAVSANVPRLILGEEGRELGTIELSGGDGNERALALEIASVLSSLLALRARLAGAPESSGTSRVLDKRHFDDLLMREIEKARRHGRAVSVLSLELANMDPALLASHLRASDAVGRSEREILVLLPETGAIGAARLRRRLTRGPAGYATLPRDGSSRDVLLKVARARRDAMARSPLAARQNPRELGALVDELLARPLLDAGALAIYPLVLSLPAALSMFRHACLESTRRGDSFVDVAGGEPIVSSIRDVEREREGTLGVVEHPASEGSFAVVLTSELGTWACTGRVDGDSISAIHGADPMFADRIVAALEATP